MSNKETNLKEKLKQALNSTIKVISDDFEYFNQNENNKNSKESDTFQLDNLNSKNDFIQARAESDSSALKKKFSDEKIFKQHLPSKTSCRSLYTIAEKIRYESLGRKMMKGIKKNMDENYHQMINSKKMNTQIKSKDDVPIANAFELYMIKKFHNIKLDSLTSNMLKFWEKDFC